jgi:hypothetical protein
MRFRLSPRAGAHHDTGLVESGTTSIEAVLGYPIGQGALSIDVDGLVDPLSAKPLEAAIKGAAHGNLPAGGWFGTCMVAGGAF